MSYRLSLLDKSPIAENETAQDALNRTLQWRNWPKEAAFTASGLRNITILPNWPAHPPNCLSPGLPDKRSGSASAPGHAATLQSL
jgi:hypothetical protein